MSDLSLIYLNLHFKTRKFRLISSLLCEILGGTKQTKFIKAYPGYFEAALKIKSEERQMHGLKRAML